jgi:NitT/TauT family transport system substrate-binding protein
MNESLWDASGPSRRTFLRTSAAGLGLAALGSSGLIAACSSSSSKSGTKKVTLQANFLVNESQLGELAALHKGFYKDEGLDVTIRQGGTNIDPTTPVLAGTAVAGEFNSSPSLMLAVSHGRPLKAFAAVAQRHPYAYISLPKTPVHTPQDLVGKRVGVNQTGVILLQALLKKNNIPQSEVKIVTIAGDITPLLDNQVDVWTGWLTQQSILGKIPGGYESMSLWDSGIHLYALGYIATNDTIKNHPDTLAALLRATARGWEYAYHNPDEAVGFLVKNYSGFDTKLETKAGQQMFKVIFTPETASGGFGTMSAANWQAQIDTYNDLKQFTSGKVPTVDEVMTMDILNATAKDRPKIDAA